MVQHCGVVPDAHRGSMSRRQCLGDSWARMKGTALIKDGDPSMFVGFIPKLDGLELFIQLGRPWAGMAVFAEMV